MKRLALPFALLLAAGAAVCRIDVPAETDGTPAIEGGTEGQTINRGRILSQGSTTYVDV